MPRQKSKMEILNEVAQATEAAIDDWTDSMEDRTGGEQNIFSESWSAHLDELPGCEGRRGLVVELPTGETVLIEATIVTNNPAYRIPKKSRRS